MHRPNKSIVSMTEKATSAVFYVRGVIWYSILIGCILWKYFAGGITPTPLFVTGLAIVFLMEAFRIYTAGYLHGQHPVARVQADFLCCAGPFGHLRNPLYVANMLRGIGICVAINEWYAYVLFIAINSLVFAIIIPYEERFLEEKFGDVYRQYKNATRRFLPRLKAYEAQENIIPSFRSSLRSEMPTLILLSILLAVIYMAFVT
jgi:protein-S-isoprenylcysteine O-methyltransferase Ste14